MSVDLDVTSPDIQYDAMSEPIELNIKSLVKHSIPDERLLLFPCLKRPVAQLNDQPFNIPLSIPQCTKLSLQ